MPLHVLQHPLGTHVLTHLRDKTTKPALFRTLSYQISLLLALEAGKVQAEAGSMVAKATDQMIGSLIDTFA